LKNHPELLEEPLNGNINFYTRMSGLLIVDISSNDGFIMMDFPADSAAEVRPQATNEQVAKLLGLSESDIVHVEVSNHCKYAVIEVQQSVDIASLAVDTSGLVCH
jgi:predicted PhzF superfamily epimerase YddE/YHI9